MKRYLSAFASLLLLAACNNNSNPSTEKSGRSIVLNDTISTPSGLKYIFLKEGQGVPIDTGSKVKAFTNLYINDSDSIFWTTAEAEDSSFVFIHGKTSLIQGFSELNSYLVEGDEVIAILPDSLAYGKSGRGDVPPGATLIYKPYVVRSVSEPKQMLTDTLKALSSQDLQTAMEFYEEIRNTELGKNYHKEIEDLMPLLGEMQKDSMFELSFQWANYLQQSAQKLEDKEYLVYFKVNALKAKSSYQEALDEVNSLLALGADSAYWSNAKAELEAILAGQ